MLETLKKTLVSQFDAALLMLEGCLQQCPEKEWEVEVGNYPFWHVAYHALFYTDLYLLPDEDSFQPREYCRENYHFFGHLPYPPYETVCAEAPYDRSTLLEYVGHCRRKARESIAAETAESLQGPCGFWWYSIPRLDFHVNNIRHIQHHAGQMSLCLKRATGIQIDWVGTGKGSGC